MLSVLDDNDDIAIDTAQLIAHTLVQANSGGGKTVACRRILEQTFGVMPQWIIDPEGEMHTLRERFPHLLAAPHGGDTVASVKTAPMLCRRLLETGASCVIDIYDLSVDERHAFVKAFAEAAMNQPRTLWRDVLVVIDEAHRYCPERGEDPSDAAGAVKNWLTAGRKRGYAMILAVQRLSTLHKSAAAECNNRLIGRTGLDTDQDRAGKALGLRRPEDREALARLKPGRFWVYGPTFCERPTEIQIGAIRTSHGRAARGKAATPPLEEARKYLAQIGDLPAEAEAELKTMEQLKARVAELDTEVRVLRGTTGQEVFSPAERKELNDKLATAFAANRKRDLLHQETLAKLVRVQTGYRELHAAINKVAPVLDQVSTELETAHTVLHGAGGCSWSDVDPNAKTAENDIRVIENSAEVPATSRINGPVGPKVEVQSAGRVRVQRDYSGNAGPRMARDPSTGGGLSTMQRRLLTACAQLGPLPKYRALLYARYTACGTVSRCWAELVANGWIVSDSGTVSITPKGIKQLGPFERLPVGRELLRAILADMAPMERKLLAACTDVYPESISKGEVLARTGYTACGTVSRVWAHLSNLNYIVSNRGNVTAAKELCIP